LHYGATKGIGAFDVIIPIGQAKAAKNQLIIYIEISVIHTVL
jgi:hypothetical protein